MNNAEIWVPRNVLIQSLKTLELSSRGKNPPDLVISCSPNLLTLKVGGTSSSIGGDGFFPGQTRISGKFVRDLKRILPNMEKVVVSQLPMKVKIGDMAFTCHWESSASRIIQIPINATLAHILGIWQRYSDEEIEKSGFKPTFEAADKERKRRIQNSLAELHPLGVTEEGLAILVDEALIRYNIANFNDDN